jgi:hypothetical protein
VANPIYWIYLAFWAGVVVGLLLARRDKDRLIEKLEKVIHDG